MNLVYTEANHSPMADHRIPKTASVIRSVIAKHALLIPPDIAMAVSITEVQLSSDGTHATVFVSALKNPDRAMNFLKKNLQEIVEELSPALQRFRTPRIRFEVDTKTERLTKLQALLSGDGKATDWQDK